MLDAFWDKPRGLAGAGSYRVLVMPLMQSVADNDLCEADHPLTLQEISLCARHILEALVELHEVRGIMHMDIKPSNILYTRDPSLRFMLIDFGQSQVKGSPLLITTTDTYNLFHCDIGVGHEVVASCWNRALCRS